MELIEKKCDYYQFLSQFMSILHDGHTGFYNLDDCNEGDSGNDVLPFEIEAAKGKFYISKVLKELTETIPLGSELLEVDNQPTLDYLNRVYIPFAIGNTFQSRLKKALSNFSIGTYKKSITIRIKTPQGKTEEKEVAYNTYANYNNPEFISILKEKREGTDLFMKKDINNIPFFYFRYDDFDTDKVSPILNHIAEEVKQADYLVLDLRRNPGGSESIADSVLMCFLNIDTLKTYQSITRINHALKTAKGYGYPEYREYYEGIALDTLPESVLIKKNLPLFDQPLFILISEETCSAAEDLLITLKLHYPNRAILVGSPTSGSTGAPLIRLLSDKVYYRICTRAPLLPEGLFEEGILPDYYYSSSWEEMVSGEDRIFEFVGKIFAEKHKNDGILYKCTARDFNDTQYSICKFCF
ncbi:MAG: hypothetical protein LBP72_06390 [Dysgonamonadaceae bacterium]|nr:hypothetical protein [Dysgonamonadaceae bacterium]